MPKFENFETDLSFETPILDMAKQNFDAINEKILHGPLDSGTKNYLFEILCMAHSQLGEGASEALLQNLTFQKTVQKIQDFDWENFSTFSDNNSDDYSPEQGKEFETHRYISVDLNVVKDELHLKDRAAVVLEAGIRAAQKGDTGPANTSLGGFENTTRPKYDDLLYR